MPKYHGIDFHPTYQMTGSVNWERTEPYPLMSVKFTQGRGIGRYEDRAIRDFLILRDRKNQGLHQYVFCYHWIHANDIPGQVNNFIRAIERIDGFQPGETWMLDWEVTADEPVVTSDQAWEFAERMRQALQRDGITYSSDWLPDSTLDPDSLKEFLEWRTAYPNAALWYANYNLSSRPDGGNAECDRYFADVWQWTDKASASGWPTSVDMNEIRSLGWVTLDRICEVAVTPPPPPPPPPPPVTPPQPSETEKMIVDLPTLVRGNTGDPVKRAQALLNIYRKAEDRLKEDGDFGPVTERAVIDFQRQWGLTPDGKIGTKETWPALLGVYVKG